MPPEKFSWVKEKSLSLLIESFASTLTTLQIRGTTETEQIIAGHITNSDRSLNTSVIPITSIPTFLTVRSLETGVKRGRCYVRISLRMEDTVIALLAGGYVSDTGTLAYPNGKIENSIEGPGLLRSVLGTDPAAGVEITEAVPTGARWRMISMRATFITDGTVATRLPKMVVDDGANEYYRSGQTISVTASLSAEMTFADVGVDDTTATGAVVALLPTKLIMPAGHTFFTLTTLIQAGDNWGAPRMLVEEWLEP